MDCDQKKTKTKNTADIVCQLTAKVFLQNNCYATNENYADRLKFSLIAFWKCYLYYYTSTRLCYDIIWNAKYGYYQQ